MPDGLPAENMELVSDLPEVNAPPVHTEENDKISELISYLAKIDKAQTKFATDMDKITKFMNNLREEISSGRAVQTKKILASTLKKVEKMGIFQESLANAFRTTATEIKQARTYLKNTLEQINMND
jgi:predicted transcriptional regulator